MAESVTELAPPSIQPAKRILYDAVIYYNEGVLGKAKAMEKVCGKSGANCIVGLKRQDLKRVYEAKQAMKEIEKRPRAARLNVKRRVQDKKQVSDDPDYACGGADIAASKFKGVLNQHMNTVKALN
ncbi:hypothetical protein J6590_098070 [Homalodisca vitripennis]|nr:hypothetical protein J6590_098070 [Homalodisca vitripennis]